MSEALDARDFAGSILVARGPDTVFLKSYGYANITSGRHNTPDTPMGVGSVSKQFTAAAVLLLAEDGRLAVTDPVSRFVPDFPHGDTITIHHLLTHRSGLLRDVFEDYRERQRGRTLAEVVQSFQHVPLQFTPGSQTSYSNAGYTLLALIVEKSSGESFPDFLAHRVFTPLGMAHTSLPLSPGPNHATGYDPGPHPDGLVPAPPQHPANTMGADGVFSTVADLHRWSEALASDALLSEASRTAMLQSYGGGRGYGVGLAVRHGRSTVGHDGITHGYIAFIDRYVDEHVTIAFLGNIRSGVLEAVRNGVSALYFGNEPPTIVPEAPRAAPDARALRALTGRYELFPGFNIDVTMHADHLYLSGTGGYPTVLTPLGDNTFFYRARYERIRFEMEDDEITGLIWIDRSGNTYPAPRTGS